MKRIYYGLAIFLGMAVFAVLNASPVIEIAMFIGMGWIIYGGEKIYKDNLL